jgi:hypothetical protein
MEMKWKLRRTFFMFNGRVSFLVLFINDAHEREFKEEEREWGYYRGLNIIYE